MSKKQLTIWKRISYSACVAAALSATGCQVEIGGQTLPSMWYLQDDVQYFAPGPEFPLAREAASMQERRAEVEALEQP